MAEITAGVTDLHAVCLCYTRPERRAALRLPVWLKVLQAGKMPLVRGWTVGTDRMEGA